MSSSGAYGDEMGRFLRLGDEELSRLLAGEAAVRDEALEEVAELLAEIRSSFSASAPQHDVRDRHLAAISEASHLAIDRTAPVGRPAAHREGVLIAPAPPTWKRFMDRTRSVALKLASGTVAASLSMMGLAYAGVDLPGTAAERALEAVSGLTLPNQDRGTEVTGGGNSENAGKSVADDVHAVQRGTLEGCERGQAIAAAASQNRQSDKPRDNNACDEDDTTTTTKAMGTKATGETKSEKGRANAADKSDGRSAAKGDGANDRGQATAAERSKGRSRSRGEGAKGQGRANKPDDLGSQGRAKKATDPGSQARAKKATDPGSQGRDDKPGDRGSQSRGKKKSDKAHSNRPSDEETP